MAADLDLKISLDTSGFDRGITSAEQGLANLEGTTKRISNQKLNITPSGGRELDAAASSADRLGNELDAAASSAQKIKPNPSVPSSLDQSSKAASQLAVEMNKAGDGVDRLGASGSQLGGVEARVSGLASTVRGMLPALSAGAAATATFTKGWGRLTSIDNAQFKLQGLGHTAASTADIMDSAMESVSGTAYGFGDAASLAATMVASGIQPGEELTQVLKTVADATAISGRELSDMGLIFGQVAASGTIMGDDINQLLDSSIPVLDLLAAELGVTAGEVKELASAGEISFAQFESAMRSGMGGAAQEMGQSVTGALANVGAAVGRLGAAALTPAFTALPNVLAGITEGVNFLTDGVTDAIGMWQGLPGPIRAAVGGLVAARGATMLLNTELGGKLVAHLLSVKDNVMSGVGAFRDFGSSLSSAYGYIRQANPEMGRMSAGMELVAGKGGVAATAMGGLRGAAGGLLSALGGPWGLAIGGASLAVGLFTQHVQKTKQAQEEAEAATKGWADALADADGQITDSVQKHAVATVQNEEWADSLDAVGLSTADAAAAVLGLDGAYESTIEQLDGLLASSWDYSQLRGQERVDARDRVHELQEVRDGIMELNGQRVEGAAQAEEAAGSERELATAVAEGFASTDKAIPKYAEMNNVLAQMSIDADTAEDAIDNLASATMSYLYGIDPDPAIQFQSIMADSAAAVQDFGKLLEDGMGGFDIETGQFDVWDEQGQKLAGTMDGLRESVHLAAAAQYKASIQAGESGVVAAQEAADAAAIYTERLRDQARAAGWSEERIDALIGTYNLTPEDIYTQIHVEGVEIADELISNLDAKLTRVNSDKYEIVVDSDALDLTKEQAEELGYTLEEVGGLSTLTAETDQARNALDEYAARTEELGTAENTVVFRADVEQLTEALDEVDDTTAEWTNKPREIPVIADTEEARAAIKELGVEATTLPDGYLYIEDNSPSVMRDLFNLGAETIALPEGNIILDTNSPEVLGMLRSVEFETITLPDGRVVLNHDDIHSAFQAMIEAGALVREGADGELRVDNNFWENEQAVEELAAKVRAGATGAMKMTHNAPDVAGEIDRTLEGKTTQGKHIITEERRIEYWERNMNSAARSAGVRPSDIQGPFPAGQTGGRFTGRGFDYLPAYAAGDRHGGYQLPPTGPGTETRDGFLALDMQGQPVARLDAREWVINGDSSEKHNDLLYAVNRDDTAAIVAAVMGRLPGLAEGGALGAATRTMPAPTPSADGGGAGVADTTNSVLDHAALLGGMIEDIPEESETIITLTAEGVADELSLIGQQLEPLGEGETITVDAVGEQAMSVLNAVGVETTTLPDGSVQVTATTADALDNLAGVSQMLFEVGDTIVDPEILMDTRELEVSASDAQVILDALDMENPTPYASIIIDDLLNGKGIAQGELEFLASMVPTPAADLNTALLQAGVQVSESELQRVGAQKATSVVDVNNQSALTNVQATLDALNRMPVERTIRIVAAGSAASAIGQFNQGGRIPALASGGRLPTTGPGTDTVDGILGVGGDGVPTAMVDAGEWVITRNRSQRFDRTLGAINAGNQRDIYEALKADMPGMQHLNKGGVVSPEQLLNFAAGQNVGGQQARQSLQGAPYVWGGVNWGDCSGAMAGLANFAAGLNAFGSRFATGNQREATAALGFKPGLGDPSTSFNLGWFNGGPWGGHTAGDVGGTAVEMGGGAGGQGKIGGAAASASSGQFTDHAHLTLGELWAFDRFESLPALTQRYQPAPDPSWQTEGGDGVSPGGLGLQLVNGFGGGVSHTGGDGVHLNNGMVIPYQKGRLYDTGGDWEKGTWGFNNIGTEHVLTPERRVDYLDAGQNIPEATRAMTRVADAVDNLHPQVRRMIDEVAPQLVGMASQTDKALNHLSAISDYQSAEGVQARATAGRVLGMDILPYSSELQGILDAETQLWDARAAQEDRARAITTAETGLSEAREELARLQKEDPGMSVQDQRKLADAEKAVGKARADGDAGKVADAEQKLARAREDVEASASKDAVKRQEDIAKATDSVVSAEQDLVQARQESVEALDASLYSVLPQLNQGLAAASGQIGGFASQLGAMGGIAAGAAPMLGGVSAQLASMAAFAGPAGISIGMALTIVDTVLSVARKIGSILEELSTAASAGRTAAAKAHAESVSAIREWTSAVDEQRQTVSRLQQSVVRAGLDIVSAQWEVRTAQLDVGRAQLEGVRSVAQAEAALAEERERQARADWWQYNDLTLAYDRLRWAQQDVAYGQLEDYATVTPEILALQHEVLAAQLISAGSVHSAQLASLQASFGLMEAQKLLARGQRDLNHAMAEYNRMSGTSFGMTTPEAMVAEEIARLQAENARLAGENPKASGLLGGLDFDGDGKILFGLVDLVGKERTALQSAIDANNRAIENLLNSGHAPDWDEATWADAMKVIDQAADMYRRGNDASADALIAGSIWGDAQRALNETKLLNEIAQWEQAQRELEDDISDLQDMIGFEEMAQPLRELIAALEAGANSAQYSADALREQNPAIRAALEALAEFEGGAARDIRDGQPIQQITIIGNNFSAEQMQELLDQLAGHGSELEVRVEALEQPDRPTAHDVMASRR